MSKGGGPQYNVQYQQPQVYQQQNQQQYYPQPTVQIAPMVPGAAVAWMARPSPIPGCPPGLEYLTMIDSLHVEQCVSLLEAFTGWETNNKYLIRNAQGLQVFYAMEETDTCMRICCGPQRGFAIYIVDNTNTRVMKISREFKCCAGCCWCAGCCDGCAHEVVIEAPVGQIVGYVKQRGSFWKPNYEIYDENHNAVLKLEGPCCILDGPCCPVENEFSLMAMDGSTQIGKISKMYAGFIKEMFTKADRFSLFFPLDLSVKTKATLLGALFLIDFMFFEKNQNNNNNNHNHNRY